VAAPSKVSPLADNVKIVRSDGTPDPYFVRQLQRLLDEKADTADLAQEASDTANAAVPQTRIIDTTAPLSGGGDLTADRTLTHDDSGVTADTYGDASNVPQITVDAKGHITAVTEVAITGGGGSTTPSWANGTGERRLFVTATATGSFSGNPQNCLAGLQIDNFFWNSSAGAQNIKFDFGVSGNVLQSIGFTQDTVQNQGTWTVEASTDDFVTSIVTLVASFSWNPASTNGLIYKQVDFASNTTSYQYYRLKKTSGSTSPTPFVNWFIFKCLPIG